MLRTRCIRTLSSRSPITTSLLNGAARHPVCSVSRYSTNPTNQDENKLKSDTSTAKPDSDPSTTEKPWYLTLVQDRNPQPSVFDQQEIKYPDDAPPPLTSIAKFLQGKLGLTDILIFDLRTNKETYSTAAAKISDFMILATAKSSKHCQKSFIELNSMLKREFSQVARVEGNINANDERKRQRRLARRTNLAKSLGSNSSVATAASMLESWYMIDCRINGIFVNIMTENRRKNLNLEELYASEEEKHLYRRQPEDRLKADEEDDNVLAGLKRLAARNQKRYYSTIPNVQTRVGYRELYDVLCKQDFQRANELIKLQKGNSLETLRTLTHALEELDENTPIHVKTWKNSFDSAWPLVLDQDPQQYWSTRLRFLKLLNCASPGTYGVEKLINDYLELKLALGGNLTKHDLLEFLQTMLVTINEKRGADYWHLVSKNKFVVKSLQLFQSVDPKIVLDEQVMSTLLRTMILSHEKDPDSLHAIYELIDFICCEYKDSIPTEVIVTVLDVLSLKRDWPKLLQFWEVGIKLPQNQDYRPWSAFINLVASSEDYRFIYKFLNGGHLLWLKRNQVEITPEIQESLDNLFAVADPEGIAFGNLKMHLLN